MANMGKLDLLTANSPAEAKEQMEALVVSIQDNSPVTNLIGLWERLSALVLQISLSVLVLASVRVKGRWWLFPVAIFLHALVDGVTVMVASDAGMVTVEVIIMCMAVAIAGLAYMIAKRHD